MLRQISLGIAVCLASAGGAVAASEDSYRIEAYVDQAPAGAKVVETVRVGRAGNGRVMVIVNAQGEGKEPVTRITREGTENPAVHLAGRSDKVVRVMEAAPGERLEGTVSVAGDGTLVLHELGQ